MIQTQKQVTFIAFFLVVSFSLRSPASFNVHDNVGDKAGLIGTGLGYADQWITAFQMCNTPFKYCCKLNPGIETSCASRMFCGYGTGRKECVQGFCYGSSDCPRKYYCNDVEVYGVDGHMGICIRNSVSGPILKGGANNVCYGSSECRSRGKRYCNDQELWGRDGMRGNCKD